MPDIILLTEQRVEILQLHPFWILCYIIKPQDASPYAIWRVQIQISDIVSHVSLEVLIDDYQSSSVYGWSHFNSSYDVYITIDKAINILFEAINPTAHKRRLHVSDTSNPFPFDVFTLITLKVLVATIDAQWEGMGDVGSARYEPALLPPCPTIRVLSYST